MTFQYIICISKWKKFFLKKPTKFSVRILRKYGEIDYYWVHMQNWNDKHKS